ncbi:MAG: 2,3-epoxybenzoyl-CoA dihydrolase [Acidimicrobiales bacterium]
MANTQTDRCASLAPAPVDFRTRPSEYRHWRLDLEAPIATLTLSVDPDSAAIGDYELKLNSYDIGVDIELADAVRRLRFEHPEIACVVIRGGLAGTFCAGANIRMLAAAGHPHKVNFCKFTNETRLEMEDASERSGLRFLAAVNGACSGGGYELAMACDHIILVDDRSSTVSLPEVPLLGVLPGTGGLTRLTDKRHVRRDRADVFATRAEGMRGADALAWGLVDELAPPSEFDAAVRRRAEALAAMSDRDAAARPVELTPLERIADVDRIEYRFVEAEFDRIRRSVDVTLSADPDPGWLLRTARELDDLLCHVRFNEPGVATIVIRTRGDVADVLAHDRALTDPADHGERETALLWARVLSRLDLTARSIMAVIEPGSCFAGVLAELALAADRTYMLDGVFEDADDPLPAAETVLTEVNDGPLPMANGLTRLRSRLWGDDQALAEARAVLGEPLRARDAERLGVVTAAADDLDWFDELRIAVEERASFSPDALTGMEANHRFCGPETMATKIFARLSAWQNWIFIRPNASGPDGALRRFGTGTRPSYDHDRT